MTIHHDTIVERLKDKGVDVRWVDAGHMTKYINDYPEVFPDFMKEGNYVTEFIHGKWIHRKGKIFTKQSLYEKYFLSLVQNTQE